MATVRHLGLLPFCFSFSKEPEIIATFGNFSPYPIGLDLKTLLRWYWVVKRWKFSATLTGTNFRNEPVNTSFEDTFFNGNNYYADLTTEKQLVCQRIVEYTASSTEDSASFQMFNDGVQKVDEMTVFPLAEKKPSLYYPGLSFGYSNAAGEIGTYLTESGGNIAGGTITVDGIVLPSYFQSNFNPPTAGSIAITPTEYWPYDPGDGGGPIYDSTTGAQLRAFPAN